jgi:tRNA (guanine37-N1)-methyltransferase
MMQIEVITLFPQMFEAITEYGISSRAIKQKLVKLGFWNPRDYATDRHRTVDDRPYGGGPGMVMMVEPLRAAIQNARRSVEQENGETARVVYLSPRGRKLDQAGLNYVKSYTNFMIIKVDRDGAEVAQEMLKKGVIVRPINMYKLPEYIRITIGKEIENEKMIEVLKEVLGK